MIAAAPVVASTVQKVAPSIVTALSKLGGVLGNLDGGTSREKARQARLELHFQGALAGDLNSARRLINGARTSASQEASWYNDKIKEVRAAQPAIMARAEELGPMTAGFGRVEGAGWQDELRALGAQVSADLDRGASTLGAQVQNGAADFVQDVRDDVARAVQGAGASATTRAANAVAGPETRTGGAVTVATNKNTLVLLAIAAVAVYFLMRK